MVREARFSWDDVERIDPALRHERPDDFEGPDDDWVHDLKRGERRRKTGSRRRRKTNRPAAHTANESASPAPRAPTDSRRHLAGADWLSAGPDPQSDAAARHGDSGPTVPEPPSSIPSPGDPLEPTDEAAA